VGRFVPFLNLFSFYLVTWFAIYESEALTKHPFSGFGHDKSQAILPYRELENPPTLFFFGDGVSGEEDFFHYDHVIGLARGARGGEIIG
jgi:hypothetical protein